MAVPNLFKVEYYRLVYPRLVIAYKDYSQVELSITWVATRY
jgi:hypothetical protein